MTSSSNVAHSALLKSFSGLVGETGSTADFSGYVGRTDSKMSSVAESTQFHATGSKDVSSPLRLIQDYSSVADPTQFQTGNRRISHHVADLIY